MRRQIALATALAMLLPLFPAAAEEQGGEPNMAILNEEAPAVQAYANKWAIIPDTAQPPVIDGSHGEAMWQQAASLGDFRTAYYNEPAAGGPTYRIAYDDNYMYVAGEFDAEESEGLARIELVVRPTPESGNYYVATIPVDPSSRFASTNWSPDWRPGNDWQRVNVPAFEKALTEDAVSGARRIEAAIPLSAFGLGAPIAAGDEWRLNIVHAFNLNTKPMLSWVPIRTAQLAEGAVAPGGGSVSASVNLVDLDRLGSVYFAEAPVGEPWMPENWTLDYVGFTEKRLSLALPSPAPTSFLLKWRTAHGDWQTLAAPTVTTEGARTALAFEHPEPLTDGIYELQLLAYTTVPADGKQARFTFDREGLIEAGLDAAGRLFPPYGTPATVAAEPASADVQRILSLIPDQFGVAHIGLPEVPELRPQMSLYRLSEDGMSLIANETGTVYPNANYPETHALTAVNRKGETVEYPYYKDSEGRKYFFSAGLWNQQLRKARSETAALAATDPLGAARLMYRFAETSERYVPRTNNEWNTYPIDSASGPPYNVRSGYWSVWKAEELNHFDLFLDIYAKVKTTNAFEVLSDELGVDAERKVLEELFMPPIEYVLSMPVEMHNVDPYIWQRLTRIGRTIGMPDLIHRTVEWIAGFLESQFLSDGFWKEVTPAYHAQVMSNVSLAMNELEGYSDPPGYVSPRTGRRFDQLDLRSEHPAFGQALELVNRLAYPNGKQVPIQDTWAHTSRTPQAGAGPLLLPASGIGRLTLGQGGAQMQLYTMFTSKYGHGQWDPLNLTLFAEGQELLPDIGYTYTKYRQFATSTIGHNTVVVNSRNMDNNPTSRGGGRIGQFVAVDGAFQALRASYPSAYAETDEYSREPWFVPFGDGNGEKGYVLDLFRVSGGDRHEYTLQGDANRNAYFRTGLPLVEVGPYLLPPGTNVQEPTTYQDFGSAEGHYPGYIYVRDVKQANLQNEERYSVTLATMDDGGAEQAKLRITGLLEPGNNELFLGRSPSVRSTRLNGSGAAYDNNLEADKYDMPKLVLRRSGTDLDSTFATVMEPYKGAADPRIEFAERLQPDSAPDGAVAVKVTYGGTTDILLSNPRHPEQPLIVGDITMYGEMGLIRLVDGETRDLYLVGGTLLAKGTKQVTGAGAVTGTIIDTERIAAGDSRNALVTSAFVPDDAAGRYVIVTHPDGSTSGFKIGQVEREPGRTIVALAEQDPGFRIETDGSSRQTSYPAKAWSGAHTLRIAGASRAEGQTPAGGVATGGVAGVVYGPGGAPVADAQVRLTGYSSVTASTHADGSYTLAAVPAGWQRVTVSKPGYARTVSHAVYVTSGQTAVLSLMLSDAVPPALSGVPVAAAPGEPVSVTSSKTGNVYLVPAGTPPVPEAIEAAVDTVEGVVYGVRAAAAAGVAVMLDTTGMAAGRYIAYAIDGNDEVSPGHPVLLIPNDLTAVDDANPFVLYSGSWITLTNAGYSGGTSRYSNTKGDYVEIPFYGKQAIVLGHRNSAGGLVDVYVDGDHRGTADYYSAQQVLQQEIFNTGLLPEGAHLIRLVLKGERSGGTSAYAQARFDALRVLTDSEIPPVLSAVTAGPLVAGSPVSATSSEDGSLYLVPASTEATATAIALAGTGPNGRSAAVTANVYGTFSTSGLPTDGYRVYAVDGAGNVSIGSSPIAILNPADAYIDSANNVVKYAGNWRLLENTGYYMGSSRYAGDKDEFVEIPFYGTRAVVLGHRNSAGGLADVYVDGVYAATVDYLSGALQLQAAIFDTGPLTEGIHTVRVVARGERSGGTSAYTQIRFDALQLLADQ